MYAVFVSFLHIVDNSQLCQNVMQSVVIDSVTYVQYVLKINSSVDVLLGNTTKKKTADHTKHFYKTENA